MFRKCLKTSFYQTIILINSNCSEMTDSALEFHFSVIHVLISTNYSRTVCFTLMYR